MLVEDALWPGLLPFEQLDDVLSATLTDKCAKKDDRVRAQVHLAVETPLVVRILHNLGQVGRQLGVYG